MRVISTNLSVSQTIFWNGKEEQTGIYKKAVPHPIFVGFNGVNKDCVVDTVHHGGLEKACYIYSYDHYNFWKSKFPNLNFEFGIFGENITVEGLDESKIFIGETFRLGEALIQISQPRQPCYKLGIRFEDKSIINEFIQAPFPGIYVRVLEEGFVKVGDQSEKIFEEPDSFTVAELYSLIYSKSPDMKMVETALEAKFLAESVKKYLKRKFYTEENN